MQQPPVMMSTAAPQAVIINSPIDQGQGANVAAKYNGHAGRGIGIAQVVFGVLAILIGIAEIVLASFIGVVSYGIWAGVVVRIHEFWSCFSGEKRGGGGGRDNIYEDGGVSINMLDINS